MSNWDEYFFEIAVKVQSQSKCLSRKIGAVLTRDNIIVATGYNGPPRKLPHCSERYNTDTCPRQVKGYPSGEGLHICPAAHAEANCIANAARVGVRVKGTIMYVTCEIPCKDCLALLINAGVKEVVCVETNFYDYLSGYIVNECNQITIRKYNLV